MMPRLSSGRLGESLQGHRALNDVIHHSLTSANIPSRLEPMVCFCHIPRNLGNPV